MDEDKLLDFIGGTGAYSQFGNGMHVYPNTDNNQRLIYAKCLYLEQCGLIRRSPAGEHHDDHVFFVRINS